MLAIWASESRGSFEVYVFLREVPKYCENRNSLLIGDSGIMGFTKVRIEVQHETW